MKQPRPNDSTYAAAELAAGLGQKGLAPWLPAVHRYNGPRHSELSAIGDDGYIYARVIWSRRGIHPWLHCWSRSHRHSHGEWSQAPAQSDGRLPNPVATLAAALQRLDQMPDGPQAAPAPATAWSPPSRGSASNSTSASSRNRPQEKPPRHEHQTYTPKPRFRHDGGPSRQYAGRSRCLPPLGAGP